MTVLQRKAQANPVSPSYFFLYQSRDLAGDSVSCLISLLRNNDRCRPYHCCGSLAFDRRHRDFVEEVTTVRTTKYLTWYSFINLWCFYCLFLCLFVLFWFPLASFICKFLVKWSRCFIVPVIFDLVYVFSFLIRRKQFKPQKIKNIEMENPTYEYGNFRNEYDDAPESDRDFMKQSKVGSYLKALQSWVKCWR